ncbi:hypothetical protein [Pseudomonas sp.]|uniref:hypothetical protein n=1 Tax=Pseudomonas sp. TaxID=306 RepID=UPI002632DABA|nr:hypothetical protein [Pseudomonas sp.]
MAALAVAVVVGIYAAGAYRIEMVRQTPRSALICTATHCAPQDATFAGLSLK